MGVRAASRPTSGGDCVRNRVSARPGIQHGLGVAVSGGRAGRRKPPRQASRCTVPPLPARLILQRGPDAQYVLTQNRLSQISPRLFYR